MRSLQINSRVGQRSAGRIRSTRRAVARERHYECAHCGFERRSWVDLRACPSCGVDMAEATRHSLA
jgi:predicted RNA-binding Zn-ribbon protein involved in translation (DUF1610 family)